MSREEIQKLLGGYATDTLRDAERRALFEAALEDQDLFDALAKEQALRDVLQDPSARLQLIAALGPARETIAARARHWLRWLRQPAALATAGAMATLLIVGGLVLRQAKRTMRQQVMVADAIAPRNELSRAAPLSTVPPSAAPRKQFRPPAARLPRPSPQLSEPSVLPAQRDAAPANLPAAPSPAPPGVVAGGARADTLAAGPKMPQSKQVPVLALNAASQAPRVSLKRAKAATPAPANLAVEYTLLLKDTAGAYAPVPSSAMLHAGDSVRLQVEPSDSGYIYLFQRAAPAAWTLVTSQRVAKAQRCVLPSTGGLQSDEPARLELLLVLSRLEQPNLASAPAADIETLASEAGGQVEVIAGPVRRSVYAADIRAQSVPQQAVLRIALDYH